MATGTLQFTNSFKLELLNAVHDLDTDTLKLAVFTSSASFSASTTAYGATNEVSSANYTAGGASLTGKALAGTTTVYFDCDDVAWTTVTFTARRLLLYNSSKSDKVIGWVDLSGDVAVSSGTFTVTMPTGDASNALIRLG